MSVLRRRITAALLAVAGALAVSVTVPAATAEAVPSERCPEGYVCFWTGPNFTGTMTVYKDPTNPDDCTGISPSAQSVFNNDDQAWDFYRDRGCRAWGYTLEPGQSDTYTRVNSWI